MALTSLEPVVNERRLENPLFFGKDPPQYLSYMLIKKIHSKYYQFSRTHLPERREYFET
jgi:hypothetical protein